MYALCVGLYAAAAEVGLAVLHAQSRHAVPLVAAVLGLHHAAGHVEFAVCQLYRIGRFVGGSTAAVHCAHLAASHVDRAAGDGQGRRAFACDGSVDFIAYGPAGYVDRAARFHAHGRKLAAGRAF